MTYEYNNKRFKLMGGNPTAQHFDFGLEILRVVSGVLAKGIEQGLNSVYLSFDSSEQLCYFLSVVLVPEELQLWDYNEAQNVKSFFLENFPSPEFTEGVVRDFFTTNQGWVGISPALRAVEARAQSLILSKLVENLPNYKEILNEVSNLPTTSTGQQKATSPKRKKSTQSTTGKMSSKQ